MKKADNHGVQGMTFGAMDAIINVLGIVVGLGVIGNKLAVVVGLLVAGMANSMGNAVGFHVSEETEGIHTRKEVWLSTILCFVGTFSVTLILLVPLLVLSLGAAMVVSAGMGICIMVVMAAVNGRRLGNSRKETAHLMLEYVIMGISVIVIAFYLGRFASGILGTA